MAKLADTSLLLHGSVNDAALTKLLRLGYIRDVTVQEYASRLLPHCIIVTLRLGSAAPGRPTRCEPLQLLPLLPSRDCAAGTPVCCAACWRVASCLSARS